ncbi:S8 family serine peptidase [Actinophytocola sp.]|uniref:S8 family serine peptidase n=1 Tax=Actinophytocola sp. TaxID=1872138 RepID=UPI002ED3DFDF
MRRLFGSVLAAVLLTSLVGGATPAAADTAGWRVDGPASIGAWVTLLTGDRVFVDGDRLAVEPAVGREGIGFSTYTEDGRTYVVPNDALRSVSSGQLDRRLFDVAGLVAVGYDDAHTAVLPTIVEGAGARISAGVEKTQALPGGAAVKVDKADADEFWAAAKGAGRIWLDGKRQVSLDVSVPQIGAPTAWDAGFDGTGVTVAILDTGIDATHPDLADRIVETENFTDAADTNDTVGHGTHVASTVAGSGAASGGKYRGVAPGADLIIGKVCPTRNCTESAILAGMEWAATRADVINLSLGGQDFPGIDPLEEAVNRLTAQTGALFVIAAGNEGRTGTVGSPSSADAALAVAAVDKQENLADFSNRGPRLDGAIKPDISAPGVGIVAALAKDSDYPVSSPGYSQLSGTSMATPHVAGAAALLAQQHPDWVAGDLKAALTGSAKTNPAIGLFGQGAGRVDVARAVTQTVRVDVSGLSLGSQAWPADDDVPVTKTVAYRNDGPTDVTLDLAAQVAGPDGKAAPAGMFTASPGRVTVPAGGSASVAFTADTRVASATGTFTGALVATAGENVVRVPVAISKGHEVRNLTVRVINRAGAPAADYYVNIFGVDEAVFAAPYHASGTAVARLRPGLRYHLVASVVSPDGTSTLLVDPVFTFTGDSEIVLDARQGTPVSVTVPNREARSRMASAGYYRRMPSGYTLSERIMNSGFDKLYTVDLGDQVPADAGTLVSEVRGFFARPTEDGTFFDSPYEYDLVWFQRGRFLTNFSRAAKQRDLATVVNRSYKVADGAQQAFMHNWGFPPEGGAALSAPIRFTVPSTRTIYYMADDVRWENRWEQSGRSQVQQLSAPFTVRAGKRYEVRWNQGPAAPTFNNRTFVWRDGDTMFMNVPPFGDQAGHTGYSQLDTGRMAFYVDGTKLVEVPKYFYDAAGPVPAAERSYRLEYEVDRAGTYTNSTAISGSWTFRSATAPTGAWTAMPLSSIGFRPQLDIDNTAPGGLPYLVPVSLTRQPGAAPSAVRSLTVEVSYDDGATWRPAPLLPVGGSNWLAYVKHPKKGSVSLRAAATFADGGTADYTVIDAYQLR